MRSKSVSDNNIIDANDERKEEKCLGLLAHGIVPVKVIVEGIRIRTGNEAACGADPEENLAGNIK
jgi:hypothetical protein